MSRGPSPSTLPKAILAALTGDPAIAGARAFAQQAAADAAPDELPELSTVDLGANLADFWRFGERRRGRGPTIRVVPAINAEALDRLEIVQDDAPFLVDSIMGEIAEQGLSVRALFHPIVKVQRDRAGVRGATGLARRESMIQVFLDRVGGDREAALARGVTETLKDVRAAVDDFPQMQALMAETLAELKAHTARSRPEEVAFL